MRAIVRMIKSGVHTDDTSDYLVFHTTIKFRGQGAKRCKSDKHTSARESMHAHTSSYAREIGASISCGHESAQMFKHRCRIERVGATSKRRVIVNGRLFAHILDDERVDSGAHQSSPLVSNAFVLRTKMPRAIRAHDPLKEESFWKGFKFGQEVLEGELSV